MCIHIYGVDVTDFVTNLSTPDPLFYLPINTAATTDEDSSSDEQQLGGIIPPITFKTNHAVHWGQHVVKRITLRRTRKEPKHRLTLDFKTFIDPLFT